MTTDFASISTGTKGAYALAIDKFRYDGSQLCLPSSPQHWGLSRSGEIISKPLEPEIALDDNRKQVAEIKPIPRINVASDKSFESVLQKGLPVVMEGVDLGPCASKWTLEYLTEKIGKDRNVRVFSSTTHS